ncbi:UNVERIFIED_CONTAM: hypothetical protein RKD50_008937 [Streptomyces canus]
MRPSSRRIGRRTLRKLPTPSAMMIAPVSDFTRRLRSSSESWATRWGRARSKPGCSGSRWSPQSQAAPWALPHAGPAAAQQHAVQAVAAGGGPLAVASAPMGPSRRAGDGGAGTWLQPRVPGERPRLRGGRRDQRAVPARRSQLRPGRPPALSSAPRTALPCSAAMTLPRTGEGRAAWARRTPLGDRTTATGDGRAATRRRPGPRRDRGGRRRGPCCRWPIPGRSGRAGR